jgi:16S rRNA (cytosine1402-N4)-methyltransferase
MDLPQTGHESVLMDAMLTHLAPLPGKIIVDGTLGRGGHSHEIAKRLGADGLLIGLDVDPRNLEFARERLKDVPCRVRFFHANFAELRDVLEEAEVAAVDGILADLGVSTNQLFEAPYGMSFSVDMPLDMRLDPRIRRSAADIVNQTKEDDLANILFNLAQERYSRRVARKIGEERRVSPITTTQRLAEIVRSAIPRRGGPPEKIDPATRTFLALRMHVNRELENLAALLETGPGLLSAAGRLAVISFQSMEDRLVKQAFRSLEQAGDGRGGGAAFRILTKKPVAPDEAEIARNPRSRSAKLRVIERLAR